MRAATVLAKGSEDTPVMPAVAANVLGISALEPYLSTHVAKHAE
jgi:hypothetical protein